DSSTLRDQLDRDTSALRDQFDRELAALRDQSAHEALALREQSARDLESLRAQSAQDAAALRDELAALRAEWRAWADAQPTAWETRIGRLERGTFLPMPRWASYGLLTLLLGLFYWLGMMFHG